MNLRPPDERSPTVVAYAWASRLTTVSLEMALPGVGGYWLDQRLGVLPAFTLIGFTFGLVLGMWHLLKMTSSSQNEADRREAKRASPGKHDGPPPKA